MRVVLISPEYPPAERMGGIGTNTATVAPALAGRGHDVCVITRGIPGRTVERGVTVVRLDHQWLPSRVAEHVLSLRTIAAAARDFRPDVVQAAEWEANAWWVARFGRTPVVTRLATPSYLLDELNARPPDARARLVRALERDQTRRSAAVFAPTRAIIDRVATDWRLDAASLAMIPNSVEIEGIRAAATREPPVPLPARFLVFLGRMERRKGIEVLGDALPRVLGKEDDLHAVLVGRDPGEEHGALMERFRQRVGPVSDRVHVLGELPRGAALAIVARAELAVFPSLWESFGYVAVEAMALGRPVVATRVGGFPEFIEDGRTGWLVRPGDSDALADALLLRLGDRESGRAIGDAARGAAERFDVRTVVPELEDLYRRAVDGLDASIYRRGYRRYFRADVPTDPFHDLYDAKRRAVLNGIPSEPRLRILDVGGGYGRLAGPLSEHHAVTLCDISPEMLEEAGTRWPRLALVEADARRLPFEDGSFDLVLAIDLLAHLPDLASGIRELARVSASGGRVVFDTTNAVPLWVLRYPSYVGWRPKRLALTLRAGGVLPEWRALVRHHRELEVRRAIAPAGLRVLGRSAIGPRWAAKWHLWWTVRL